MTIKILAFDTETTGLDPSIHEIIQLSGCIVTGETSGSLEPVCWFDLRARPDRPETAAPEALAVHGYTLEQLAQFPGRRAMYSTFIGILGEYVDKFDRNDKYMCMGYNVDFDINMLSGFFNQMGDKYLGSWLNWRKLDVMGLAAWRSLSGEFRELPNFKLATLAEYYGIEIKAHDSLSDIAATVNLWRVMADLAPVEPFDVIRNYEYKPAADDMSMTVLGEH